MQFGAGYGIISSMKILQIGFGLMWAAVICFAAEGKALPIVLSNEVLKVSIDCESAAMEVVDLRCGREWKQMAGEGAKVEVLASAADLDGKGAALLLRLDGVDGEVRERIRLEGAEVGVELDSAAENRIKDSFDFPYPFEARAGERLLLPNGCGYAIPVEAADLGTTAFDAGMFWTREMKMSAWGQYSERSAADGSLVGAGGVLGIVETPSDVWLRAHVRGNGLRQANVSWGGENGRFGYARKMRYVFFVAGGPMEMARRVRKEMARRGLLVTFREKMARHPEMAEKYDLLAGAPIVWYWEEEGDKAGVARRLKELGFRNFIFSGITRRDLGAWVTADEVKEIAKVPGVLQAEYDIYADTMERAMLDKIDAVRPHWPLDAWERDDVIRMEDGTAVRGWKVPLKGEPGKPAVGCAILCPARALGYMRERIGARLREAPYGARFFDVTGANVGWCGNKKHALTRREGEKACKKMFALAGDEFSLICGTEDGIECYVPEVDYFEGNFSSWAYRVDAGRYMWKIYDETPEVIEKGLDPTWRVPFWEMVFHDCIVSTWYWTDYNNKFPKAWWKHDLLNAVTGTAPMYLFTRQVFEGIEGRLAESVKVTTPIARGTFGVQMTDYRWLTADRLVQQSEFANGVRVTVNFGEKAFRMADGFMLEAHGHRFEGLDGVAWDVDGEGGVRVDFAGESFCAKSAVKAKVKAREKCRVEMELETVDGPVQAVWESSEKVPRVVDLYLRAPKGRKMTQALDYPLGWETKAGDDLILPFGEGVAYPVMDEGVRFVQEQYAFACGMEAAMGFFGVGRGGIFAMTGVDGQLDAAIFCETNRPYRAGVRWLPMGGTWGEDRHVRFFFGRSIGDVAGAYRAWRESEGRVRTLADKAKENPRIRDFAGAADFWLWDDNNQNRLYNWPLVKESAPLDIPKIAAEMKALGLERVLLNSFEGMSSNDCAALEKLGYFAGTYDCLRDVFHAGLLEFANPSNFVRNARFLPMAERVARIERDGTRAAAWAIPDSKGKMHAMWGLCDLLSPEMCRDLIAPEVAARGYTSRLMDVQSGLGPCECFSKEHPCTRAQALEAICAGQRYLSDELDLIVGVEVGSELFMNSFHYSEGLTSCPVQFRKPLCWRYKDRALYGDEVPVETKKYLHNPRYRVPLWELVYHDCTVSYWYWADSTLMYPELCELKDAFGRLWGLPPIYSMNVATWNKLKNEVALSYQRAAKCARETMFSRMTEFEYLSEDRLIQRTTFANGHTETVDFHPLVGK